LTKDNRKKNIAAEVARGDRSMSSARILAGAGEHADAVSRAYYAAFHYARALLLTVGEESKTHGGLERLVQREFVKPGTLDPDVALLLSRLQKYRQDADYAAEFVFSQAAANEELRAAERFVAAVEQILKQGSWI
jgi:uncharacterized protein (UPF0332 family)